MQFVIIRIYDYIILYFKGKSRPISMEYTTYYIQVLIINKIIMHRYYLVYLYLMAYTYSDIILLLNKSIRRNKELCVIPIRVNDNYYYIIGTYIIYNIIIINNV